MGSGLAKNGNGSNAVGAYTFSKDDVIGRGAVSTVYRATCIEKGRMSMDTYSVIPSIVAIKIIPKSKNTTNAMRTAAIHEAKYLIKLRHRASVRVYEYFETDASIYMVMEYLTGGNLIDRVKKLGSIGENEVAYIMQQLASVLATMGGGGVIHRDIRGENIMFEDATSYNVRLINFGKAAVANGAAPSQATNGSMSAFLLCGNQVDLFALGVLMYYMISGAYPFGSSEPLVDARQILFCVLHDELSFDEPQWKHISEDAKVVIGKLLDPDPECTISSRDLLQDQWIQSHSSGIGRISQNSQVASWASNEGFFDETGNSEDLNEHSPGPDEILVPQDEVRDRSDKSDTPSACSGPEESK